MPGNLQLPKALTTRKGHAASVRRQSRQRLRSERRYIFSRAAALRNERRCSQIWWRLRSAARCVYRQCLPEIATGAKRPRNDNSGAVTILTEACFARQCAAGPGCPRPYSALSMSAQKFINYSASLKYAASSCIRLSSNGEVRLPSCSMARNVDSGAAYSRSLKAFKPAPGVSCSSW